jgi:hypothetical protein
MPYACLTHSEPQKLKTQTHVKHFIRLALATLQDFVTCYTCLIYSIVIMENRVPSVKQPSGQNGPS